MPLLTVLLDVGSILQMLAIFWKIRSSCKTKSVSGKTSFEGYFTDLITMNE